MFWIFSHRKLEHQARLALWIIFDPFDRLTSAPDFQHLTDAGKLLSLHEYYESSNLVICFPSKSKLSDLQSLSVNVQTWLGLKSLTQAEILLLLPIAYDQIDRSFMRSDAHVQIAYDPGEIVRGKYANLLDSSLVDDDDDIIYVLDQYAGPYSAWVGKDTAPISLIEDIQRWLTFIEIQCPE